MKASITCRSPQQAHTALTTVLWPKIKSHLLCGGGALVVSVKPETRTLAENALLHAIIAEIAANIQWAGKKHDAEVWKRLLVAAWCRVRGEPIEILPALDGNGVDIVPARTSKLTKKDCADLIEFIYAWGAENGIIWASK